MVFWAMVVLWCLGRWWFLWYFSDYCVGIGVFVEIICSCFRWLHLNDGKMEEFREMSFTRNSPTHIRPWSDSFFVWLFLCAASLFLLYTCQDVWNCVTRKFLTKTSTNRSIQSDAKKNSDLAPLQVQMQLPWRAYRVSCLLQDPSI